MTTLVEVTQNSVLHSLSSAICVKFDRSLLELKNSLTVLGEVLQLLQEATNAVGNLMACLHISKLQ